MLDMRRCSRCKLKKPLTEFNRKRDGLQSRCRPCCAIIQRQIRYGVTDDEWQRMMTDQDGLCAICHKPEPRYKYLAVDHDHETGKPRGLLCSQCNPMIGYAAEDPDILRAAIDYLEVHRYVHAN